jgi:hypothetical protein
MFDKEAASKVELQEVEVTGSRSCEDEESESLFKDSFFVALVPAIVGKQAKKISQ